MCSCRKTRFVDYASSQGRSFSVNRFFWSWRPLSRFVVSKICMYLSGNNAHIYSCLRRICGKFPFAYAIGINTNAYSSVWLYWRINLAFVLQVTSTGNTMTYWGSLSMGASLQKATTCFWVTMWTGGSSLWRLFVSCWPTKLNIQRISSCWGETTSVLQLTEYMVSMMSVSTYMMCHHFFLTTFLV